MPNMFTLTIIAMFRLLADLPAEAGIHSPSPSVGTIAAFRGISVNPTVTPSHLMGLRPLFGWASGRDRGRNDGRVAMPIVAVDVRGRPGRGGKPSPTPAWIGAG